MKKLIFICSSLLAITLLIAGCSNIEEASLFGPANITVAAPYSMDNALTELKPIFESQYSEDKITLTLDFNSSEDQVTDIEKGSNIDFFIASAQKPMNELAEQDLIVPETKKNFVSNPLVLIVPIDSTITSVDAIDSYSIRSIVIGDPDTIPVGKYAEEALINMGIYEDIEYKLSYAQSSTQLIETVESREAEAGIVFQSDAINDIRVRVVGQIPATAYTPVNYPMAEIAGTKYSEQVEKLETFLSSQTALDVMNKYGFTAPTQ